MDKRLERYKFLFNRSFHSPGGILGAVVDVVVRNGGGGGSGLYRQPGTPGVTGSVGILLPEVQRLGQV